MKSIVPLGLNDSGSEPRIYVEFANYNNGAA